MRFTKKKKGKVTVDDSGLTKGLILDCFAFTPKEMKQKLQRFFDSRRKSITFKFDDDEVVIISRED